jgi:hypothetical protein
LGDLTHLLPRPAGKRKFFAAFFSKKKRLLGFKKRTGDALARIAGAISRIWS